MDSSGLLSTQDVADFLGVSSTTVKRIVKSGDLEAITVGSRLVRFTPESIQDYLAQAGTKRSA